MMPKILVTLFSLLISFASASQQISVIAPNGGEQFHVGDTIAVKWSADSNSINTVVLQITVDGGRTMLPISPRSIMIIDKSWGNYRWIIPEMINGKSLLSNDCLIEVSDYHNGSILDQSDSMFKILPRDVSIINPPISHSTPKTATSNERSGRCGAGVGLALIFPFFIKLGRKCRWNPKK